MNAVKRCILVVSVDMFLKNLNRGDLILEAPRIGEEVLVHKKFAQFARIFLEERHLYIVIRFKNYLILLLL